MPRDRVTLLDRAKGDLIIAETMLGLMSENGIIVDACAYHCQQCVEKTVKFLITLQGDVYSVSHDTDEYLQDLKDGEIKELVKNISMRIDRWATTIRYSHTLISNKNTVSEVLSCCKKLIEMAGAVIPEDTVIQEQNKVRRVT